MKWFLVNSLVLLLLGNCLWGQKANFQFTAYNDSILKLANSASEVDYMTEGEKQVIFYINLLRMNPALFSESYLQPYLDEHSIKKDKDVKELMKELEETEGTMPLKPSELLTKVARNHAVDMGETGRTGHTSSDGKSFKERMAEVSEKYAGVNENANYGLSDPLAIVIDLLIDRGVPNKGHRKNMLDPLMEYVGVAIEPHKRLRYNCVQVFAGEKR
ncbi:MAG: hypothetical protein Kow0075_08110 [Salibacteraceae bacterium]